jgi:K+/H+ antiporter YhaU regulatory subunit KhtT
MADVKMTQREYFAEIIKLLRGEDASISADDAVEFVEGRIDVLSRKSGSRKPSKVQAETELAKAKVLEVLTTEGQTVTEILGKVDFSEFSFEPTSQKISAMLKKMVEIDKTVVKTVDKKKSLFSLA